MLVHTLPSTLRAVLGLMLFSTTSHAFQVSPDSPCSSQCTIDGAGRTNSSEIVCSDADFSTTTSGLKFKNCIECMQNSSYFSGLDRDVDWFLYNLRYAADVCLFQYPGPDSKNETSPCNVDYVCKPLQNALETDQLSTESKDGYGYCTADNSAFRSQSRETCIGCLQGSPSNKYLSNFLIALEAGCEQQPPPGKHIGLSGSLFSSVPINVTDSISANGTATGQDKKSIHLSVGAIVGIAVGAGGLFLIGAVLLCLYYCRQRKYNKEDRARRASYASFVGYPTYPLYPGENTEIALQGPSYTLDYKSPVQEHEHVLDGGGSEVSYDKSTASDPNRRQPSVHSRQLSREELQKSPSAMPIHPAYIPRAIMRRNSPGTSNPSQFSSAQHSRNPSFDSQRPGGQPVIALSPPPAAARRPSKASVTGQDSVAGPQPSSHSASGSISSTTSFSQRRERQTPAPLTLNNNNNNNNTQLESDIHRAAARQLEQHGIYAADQQEQHYNPPPQPHHQATPPYQPSPNASLTAGPGPTLIPNSRPRASSTSSNKSSPQQSTNPIQPVPLHAPSSSSSRRGNRQHQPTPPPLTLSGPQQQQQQYTPNTSSRLRQHQKTSPPFQQGVRRNDAPLPGMEDIEISGPLAFRDDARFRDAAGGVPLVGHGTVGPGAARFVMPHPAGGGQGGGFHQLDRDRVVEQTFIRKGFVQEVPLESAREDLW
ncbi:hypothetical protein GE09DRAFT_1215427 [Coniochaeta sp. 2T2.1]|nr:hypothetical protein GE09DRAFT_1215427 [Coniochaeta sp. 2T2.1]